MIIAILLVVAAVSATPVSQSRFSFVKEQVAASKNPQVSVTVSKSRGIGFLATRDLRPGERILSTPAAHTVHCHDAFPFSMAFSRAECHYRLMARAMYDRWVNPNPGMPADYFRAMVDMDDLVYFWDRDSKEYLVSAIPGVLGRTEAKYEEMKAKFISTMKEFPGIEEICPECVTEGAFNWAFWIMLTHGRKSDSDESLEFDPTSIDEQISAFFPISDMHNHLPLKLGQATQQGYIRNTTTHSLDLYTDRAVKQGQEVFISYARDSSLDLFRRYGFLVHRSPDERLFLNLTGEKACVGEYNPATNLCKVTLYLGPVEKRLILSLRLEFMSAYDLLTDQLSPIDTSLEHYYRGIPAHLNDTDDTRVTKGVMLKASLRYRAAVLSKSSPTCANAYRESVRRVRGAVHDPRERQVDELCQIVWETQFAVRKPIERYLMFILQYDLGLKKDLDLS